VAANRRFREQLRQRLAEEATEVIFAPPELCTDNAVMGALAWEKVRVGQFDELTLDIQPGLVRQPVG
jgi:N6-L-threonylcarbamoyladenine synthase